MGSCTRAPDTMPLLTNKRRHTSSPAPTPPPQPAPPSYSMSPSTALSNPRFGEGSSKRPKHHLLDALPREDLGYTKLPKTGPVLQVLFLKLLQSPGSNPNNLTLATRKAAREMVVLVKRVWRHHFGPRLVYGVEHEGGVVYWGIWVIFILWVDILLNGSVKWRCQMEDVKYLSSTTLVKYLCTTYTNLSHKT